MLWAIIDQFTLPTYIDWYGLVDWDEVPSDETKTDIVACWRGALQHGLIDGQLDDAEGVLHLTWAITPWLLIRPGPAAAWARNYDRVYPGALGACGIPAHAWQEAGEWHDWLTRHPERP